MVTRPWKSYGPFSVEKEELQRKLSFSKSVNDEHLECAAGVYIIAVKHGKRFRIRYIGMTYEQGFLREVFSPRNGQDVWSIIAADRGSAWVWLFAKPNISHQGFSWDARLKKQAHQLEELMILMAKGSGHDLLNDKKMKSSDGISVLGLFGAKRPAGAPMSGVRALRRALKL